jgi:DNA-binding response OmpR family regulator
LALSLNPGNLRLLVGIPILIVEDEPLIALQLKALVEDVGGKVIGPVGSVRGAMELLQTEVVAAAILDIQLTDGDVTPVAQALAAREVPVILQSGLNPPPALKRLFPDVIVHKKPVSGDFLIERLAELIKR